MLLRISEQVRFTTHISYVYTPSASKASCRTSSTDHRGPRDPAAVPSSDTSKSQSHRYHQRLRPVCTGKGVRYHVDVCGGFDCTPCNSLEIWHYYFQPETFYIFFFFKQIIGVLCVFKIT